MSEVKLSERFALAGNPVTAEGYNLGRHLYLSAETFDAILAALRAHEAVVESPSTLIREAAAKVVERAAKRHKMVDYDLPDAAFAKLAAEIRAISATPDRRVVESPSTAEAVDAERAWRCFHCDEVFTDKGTASAHFGDESLCGPACKIAGPELGLVGYIRKLERQISDYQAENDPLSIAWYAQRADHARALVMAEQSGYDKGLADGRSALNATLIREAVEAERGRILSDLRAYRCPNDGGFDRDTGPIDCSLDAQDGQCACVALFNIVKAFDRDRKEG